MLGGSGSFLGRVRRSPLQPRRSVEDPDFARGLLWPEGGRLLGGTSKLL
jgi:hypothetical protein